MGLKMGRLFFADEYVRHYADAHTAKQSLPQVTAIKLVREVLPDLELRVIEFLSEWTVSLLMPAKHLIKSPLCWVKNTGFVNSTLASKLLHPSINESYRKTIDGQIRCITADSKPKGANVAWNVNYINVFIPAWIVPPIYHSLRREYVTFMQSPDEIGVRTLRPGFEDETVARLQLDRPIPLIPCMACALPSGKTPFHSAISPTLQP